MSASFDSSFSFPGPRALRALRPAPRAATYRPGRVPETIRRSIFRTISGTQTISWPFWSPTICRTILATIFARRFFKHSCCVLSRKSVFGKLARKLAHKLARKLAHKLAHKLASKLASDIVRRPSGVRSQRHVWQACNCLRGFLYD